MEKLWDSLYPMMRDGFSTSIQEKLKIRIREEKWEQPDPKDSEQKYKDATEIIICDGNIIQVSQSLYDALLQLRKRLAQEYWIDALCINQRDDKEKSSQVQMMGQIYRKAKLVLVWLGTVPTSLSVGYGDIESSWQRLFSDELPEGMNKDREFRDTTSEIRWWRSGLMDYLTICHLITRRYFQRTWVVQEIALSKNVTFLLGKHYFGPETFFKVAEHLRSPEPKSTRRGFADFFFFGNPVPGQAAQFASLPLPHPSQTVETDRTGTWSLHDWLETCIGRKASNDMDLAFAGLALVRPELLHIRQSLQSSEASRPPLPPRPLPPPRSAVNSSPPPLPPRSGAQAVAQGHRQAARSPGDVELWPRLRADYAASRREVLVNLAACVLSGPDPISLLSLSSQYRARSKLASSSGYNRNLAPSWVPALAPWSRKQRKLKSLGDYGVDHSAATDVQNDFRISSDGSKLLLGATRLGIVQDKLVPPRIDSSPESSPSPGVYDCHSKTLQLLRKLSLLSMTYRDTDRSHLAAFVSASTWGLHGRDQLALQDAIQGFFLALDSDFDVAMEIPYERLQEASAVTSVKRVKEELREAYEVLKKVYPDVARSKRKAQSPYSKNVIRQLNLYSSSSKLESVKQQRLFTTDTGYIGQTMTGVKSGDEVVLVHGASVPYIFRRVEDAIRTEIEVLRSDMEGSAPSSPKIQRRQKMIGDLEGQLGTRNGWVVVGEAYIEGVMNGEAVGECIKRGERFSLV